MHTRHNAFEFRFFKIVLHHGYTPIVMEMSSDQENQQWHITADERDESLHVRNKDLKPKIIWKTREEKKIGTKHIAEKWHRYHNNNDDDEN